MGKVKKEQVKGIITLILFVLIGIVVVFGSPILITAVSSVIFMWCHNNGLVELVKDSVNPITFLQSFFIVFCVSSIRTNYLGSRSYFSDYIKDEFSKSKEWVASVISWVLIIVFFIVDVVVFQYTYDVILPQVFKFSIPELDDVQLTAVFIGLNILLKHPAPSDTD
jgi:hypothetical protein